MKKIYVLVFTAMVTIGLLGCNNSNNMFEKENKSDLKKDMFVSTFEENSDLIKTVCLGNNSNRSVIASEEAEYDYYINNPSALYEDLLQEENGAEYIEYFTNIEFDFQVFLYKSSGLSETLYSDENESINLSNKDFDEIFVKIYSAFGFYNQYEPYYLEIKGG